MDTYAYTKRAHAVEGIVQQGLEKARSSGVDPEEHAELVKALDFLSSAAAHNRAKLESKLA